MNGQKILTADEHYAELDRYFEETPCKRLLLVCGKSIRHMRINAYFAALLKRKGITVICFDDFSPNPLYESAVKGVELFRREGCDAIAAVGGGSAIDMGKCIKLYSSLDPEENYLRQAIVPNDIPFLAVPTTCGSGSEATKYAVLYYEGMKQSITHESAIPKAVLFDPHAVSTLPEYQRKATMMDAFCHALESFWSVNSTEESRGYSREAIRRILAHMDGYLNNDAGANREMLLAAHTAGRAINITQTTAGHAMCYKLTGLYGISHGHAAALCDRELFRDMIESTVRCIDRRGAGYLENTLNQIAEAMDCAAPEEAAEKFSTLVTGLGLGVPEAAEGDYAVLRSSVNPVRMKNHPVMLDEERIDRLYHQILA